VYAPPVKAAGRCVGFQAILSLFFELSGNRRLRPFPVRPRFDVCNEHERAGQCVPYRGWEGNNRSMEMPSFSRVSGTLSREDIQDAVICKHDKPHCPSPERAHATRADTG
jgi:hypothetical protein